MLSLKFKYYCSSFLLLNCLAVAASAAEVAEGPPGLDDIRLAVAVQQLLVGKEGNAKVLEAWAGVALAKLKDEKANADAMDLLVQRVLEGCRTDEVMVELLSTSPLLSPKTKKKLEYGSGAARIRKTNRLWDDAVQLQATDPAKAKRYARASILLGCLNADGPGQVLYHLRDQPAFTALTQMPPSDVEQLKKLVDAHAAATQALGQVYVSTAEAVDAFMKDGTALNDPAKVDAAIVLLDKLKAGSAGNFTFMRLTAWQALYLKSLAVDKKADYAKKRADEWVDRWSQSPSRAEKYFASEVSNGLFPPPFRPTIRTVDPSDPQTAGLYK